MRHLLAFGFASLVGLVILSGGLILSEFHESHLFLGLGQLVFYGGLIGMIVSLLPKGVVRL